MQSDNSDTFVDQRHLLETSEHASDDLSDKYDEDEVLTNSGEDQNSRGFGSSCATKPKCPVSFRLAGTLSCTSTSTQKIYCWDLVVDNCTGKTVRNVNVCLDVRSLQANESFAIGPGVFGPEASPDATYSVEASEPVTGTAVDTYEGTGTFFRALCLPTGASSFTLCATFELPEPILNFTQVLDSPFSVKPQSQNYNSCSTPAVRSATVFVEGCDAPLAVQCPEFVEWDSTDAGEPPSPCVDCALDGRIRFAVDVITGCVTHICRNEAWTCVNGAPQL